MRNHNKISAADFNARTLDALTAKDVRIVATIHLRGAGDRFETGQTGYIVDSAGAKKLATHLDVLKMAVTR